MALVSYPEFLQTRTYSAQQLRHLFAKLGLQEGVYGATDLQVSQRAAGANMSVDVAAGDALVQGDDITRQGLYHVVNDGVVNVPISASHGALPRLDQIILRVYDSTVLGVSDVPSLEVLAGTPTAGATLDNRSGAATLPNNAIRLADVLVGAGVAVIANSALRDRRPWVRGANYRYERTSAGSYTITSSSYVAIDSTNLTKRIECSGTGHLEIELLPYSVNEQLATGSSFVAVFVDGASAAERRWIQRGSFNDEAFPPLKFTVKPTAGSKLIEMRAMHPSSGQLVIAAGPTLPLHFTIREELRGSGDNG
jgi:hypothetical protein